MNQTLLSSFGTSTQRVEHALDALREGRGVMVLNFEDGCSTTNIIKKIQKDRQ